MSLFVCFLSVFFVSLRQNVLCMYIYKCISISHIFSNGSIVKDFTGHSVSSYLESSAAAAINLWISFEYKAIGSLSYKNNFLFLALFFFYIYMCIFFCLYLYVGGSEIMYIF